ncbi:7-carboxy-7-deazaguanine synthase [uncultured Desulfobacterium sp.]|uniref:7-carboxy-7-deazaguanine synthase n=1 Tax=uncultured Desulfobacterium sp. TaxID=201089 RepID=A0A445MUQ5_9BACT|nr:7-carboxy-7-deazaguanine synthase [uncultured Desulfobacterium sp.]
MSLLVNEIFYSIQGESSYAGRPCVFIRLTGCNLRCLYCDTRYAYSEGFLMGAEEILERVSSYECPLVEITGGEPLLQDETSLLTTRLLDKGHMVLLETNGSLDIGGTDERCIRIMDIKCPSSGEQKSFLPENLGLLMGKDEIKFVIGDRQDYEFARKMLNPIRRDCPATICVNFSAVFEKMDARHLAEWILGDHLDVRINVQIQKVLWGPEQRGV